jgi:hypothetical protein
MNSHPATKLPWDLNKEGNIVGDSLIVAKMDRGHFMDREGDAAYIAHAANAYPKLVEALRNAIRSDKFKAIAEMEAAALLRELGE